MSTFTRSGLFTPYTPVFNATGQPAISLPLYEGEDGLPLGVQIVGAPAGEERAAGAGGATRSGACPGRRRPAPRSSDRLAALRAGRAQAALQAPADIALRLDPEARSRVGRAAGG